MSTTRSPSRTPYWFHAKRYGGGWGLPATWQGWVILIAWIVIVTAGSAWLASRRSFPLFYAFLAAMSALLLTIGYAKGEPPRWRWSGRKCLHKSRTPVGEN